MFNHLSFSSPLVQMTLHLILTSSIYFIIFFKFWMLRSFLSGYTYSNVSFILFCFSYCQWFVWFLSQIIHYWYRVILLTCIQWLCHLSECVCGFCFVFCFWFFDKIHSQKQGFFWLTIRIETISIWSGASGQILFIVRKLREWTIAVLRSLSMF